MVFYERIDGPKVIEETDGMIELFAIAVIFIVLVLNEHWGRKQDPPDDDPPLGIGGNL